ncbi:MAG: ATP-grasp domain-containing protein, partial [Sedimentibacter sp.]
MAEDREKFDAILEELGINRPKGKAVMNLEDGIKAANSVGYPVLVRPSYVLGGQGMEITYTEEDLVNYLGNAFEMNKKNPVLIDKYLVGREIEVDAICDGEDVLIPGIMEHLERAGIHSGDSISIYPPENLSHEIKQQLGDITKKIANALKTVGMVNIQFIEFENELYIIEVNPRSSRTVPYISKVTKIPMIEIATRVMLGEKLKDMGYGTGLYKEADLVAVKVPVFSTQKLDGVDVSLGPEMKSTGEVLGVGKTYNEALYKGFIAAGVKMPDKGKKILATICDKDKDNFLPIAIKLNNMGYKFVATQNTAKYLNENGINTETVKKVREPKPNLIDFIRSGVVGVVIDIPTKANDINTDGFRIRRTAVEASINVFTSLDTISALTDIMETNISTEDVDVYNISK